ncbi:MAG: hypothetical protein IKP14_12330 [Clostridiales bacterium]|nr:hypothetical protein [Clostridiales bacterium]
MSIFSKLFHKDERNEAADKKADPNVVELPCGKFIYAEDDPDEIGYEGEIDWYYQPVEVFIEVDTPGIRDAGLGFERFTRLYEDRERIDFKMKLAVAEAADYADRMSRDEFIEKSKIVFISVYSNGKRVFHIEHPRTRDGKSDARVIYDEHDKTTVTEGMM